jgi:hypothetical protein
VSWQPILHNRRGFVLDRAIQNGTDRSEPGQKMSLDLIEHSGQSRRATGVGDAQAAIDHRTLAWPGGRSRADRYG